MLIIRKFDSGARVRFKSRQAVPRQFRNAIGVITGIDRPRLNRPGIRAVEGVAVYRISIGEREVTANGEWLLPA